MERLKEIEDKIKLAQDNGRPIYTFETLIHTDIPFLIDTVRTLTAELEAAKEELATIKYGNEWLRGENESLIVGNAELRKEADDYLEQIIKGREDIGKLEIEKVRLVNEIYRLKRDDAAKDDKMLDMDAEVEKLQQVIAEMEEDARRFPTLSEFSNLQDDLEAAKAENAKLRKRLEGFKECYYMYKDIAHLITDEGIAKQDFWYAMRYHMWKEIRQAVEGNTND